MTILTAANPALSRPAAQVALILAGSALIALSAQITVPMIPVPMTLQTLAISLIGLAYGARLAAATVLAYLVEGALGMPVFSNGGAGLAWLVGPTGGFLFGFVGMAWLTGFLVERGLDRGTLRLFIAAVVPAMMLFVPGTIGLMAVLGKSLPEALAAGTTPFLLAGLVKALIAAMAIAGGWSLLDRR